MALPYIPTTKIVKDKTAEEQITDLINDANGGRFKPGQLVFGTPQATDANDTDYTQLETRLVIPSGLSAPLTFEYNRLSLEKIASGFGTKLNINPDKATADSIKVAARLALGLPINHITLVNGYTAGDRSVTFQAVDNSLLCYGQITFSIMASITDRILTTTLGGYMKPIGFINDVAVPKSDWDLDAFQP